MYNRYQGNTGKVVRVRESHDKPSAPPPSPQYAPPPESPPSLRLPDFLGGGLGRLFGGKMGELETEDIILLLILYLMYRDSGDSELLIIMGAMFLL